MTAPRSLRGALVWAGGIVVVIAVLGVVCGLVWRSLLDAPRGVVVGHQWYPNPPEAGERTSFDATGWYVVIAVVAGLAVGVIAAVLGRARELWTLAGVLVGTLLAAWLMRLVGLHGAPPDPQVLAKHAADGTKLPGTLGRPGVAAFVTWPLAALVPVGAIFLIVPGRGNGGTTADSAPPG